MNAEADTVEYEKQRWVTAQIIDLIYSRAPLGLALSVVVAGLMVFMLRHDVPAASRFGWLAAFATVVASRLALWRQYMRVKPGAAGALLWGRRLVIGTGAMGIVWGAAALLFFVPDNPASQTYLAVAIGGTAAGGLLALGAYPPAFRAFCVPMLLPLAARFAFQSDETAVVTGMLIAGFGAAFIVLAERLHRDHYRAFSLHIENSDLVGVVSAATEAAKSADLAKAAFLGSVSHEMRTPLNAILGFSEILRDELFGTLGAPQYRDYAALIHNSAEHLLEVINEVLNISQAESGKLRLDEETVDVGRVIGSCVDLVAGRAGTKAAPVAVRLAPDIPPLRADPRRLRQILLNLLSNALKFTPRNGRIELSAAVEPAGALAIVVSDTGVGMSPDDVVRATQPFARGDARLSRRFSGVGVGLPLSKALIELHGGELAIMSREGAGTSVTVRFPKERLASGVAV